jgi:hypothetical protein
MFLEIGRNGTGDKGGDLSIDGSRLQTDTFDERTSSDRFWLDFS